MRQWLIDAREKKRLSMADVSRAVGMSPPSYWAIENGKHAPKIKNAKKIASLLGFNWTKFFKDEE